MAKEKKKKKKTTKGKPTKNFDISVGSRVLYGKILFVWDDPLIGLDKWVFIKNDDPKVYKSYSLYKYKNSGKGELMLVHFIPPEILNNLLEIDYADICYVDKKKDTGGKSKKGE